MLYVFSKNVKLDVYNGAWLEVVEVGVLIGVRNDGNRKLATLGVYHRETDTIDRNGSLWNSEVVFSGS